MNLHNANIHNKSTLSKNSKLELKASLTNSLSTLGQKMKNPSRLKIFF